MGKQCEGKKVCILLTNRTSTNKSLLQFPTLLLACQVRSSPPLTFENSSCHALAVSAGGCVQFLNLFSPTYQIRIHITFQQLYLDAHISGPIHRAFLSDHLPRAGRVAVKTNFTSAPTLALQLKKFNVLFYVCCRKCS